MVSALPRICIDSNSGGETRRPETATRSGPKATRGLSPSPSIEGVAQGGLDRFVRPLGLAGRSSSAPSDAASTSPAFVGQRRARVVLDHQRRGIREQEAEHARRLAEQLHALLHERRGLGEHRALRVGQRLARARRPRPGTGTVRSAKSSSVEQADVVAVDRLGLLQVEAGRVGVHVDHVERGDHLVDREDVAVVRRATSRAGRGS